MTIYRHPKTPNYSKSTRIIIKFESPEFAQPAVVNWLGWVAWLAGWTGWAGWLTRIRYLMTVTLPALLPLLLSHFS